MGAEELDGQGHTAFPGRVRYPGEVRSARPPTLPLRFFPHTPRDGRRDRIEEAGEYAKFQVRYYWIVDPERECQGWWWSAILLGGRPVLGRWK